MSGCNGRPTGNPSVLDFRNGEGMVVTGEQPDEREMRIHEKLTSPERGLLSAHWVNWQNTPGSAHCADSSPDGISPLTADATRSVAEAGAQERLSETGDNLPNVIQYLKEQHESRLAEILKTLSERVPRLERVESHFMPDGRLLCRSRMHLLSSQSLPSLLQTVL